MRPTNKPQGFFKGSNFMTPNVLGYYKLLDGYAELAEGTGMQNQPIFGVTTRRQATGDASDGRGKLFQSRDAAVKYINDLS